MTKQTLSIYQVDAFTDRVFSGNPAAVCPLQQWLADDVMQNIAFENNLSETAFYYQRADGDYDLRWFTPAAEVDLCGHATLATAYVIFEVLKSDQSILHFHTESGMLKVSRDGELLVLDFPARPPVPVSCPEGFKDAVGMTPVAFLKGAKNLAIFNAPEDVAGLEPDMDWIAKLEGDGLICSAATAKNGDDDINDIDFVSRYFAPHVGIDEDPVTGSAHTELVPYWAERLGKNKLHARQISARGGSLFCTLSADRVLLAGTGVLYLKGEIFV